MEIRGFLSISQLLSFFLISVFLSRNWILPTKKSSLYVSISLEKYSIELNCICRHFMLIVDASFRTRCYEPQLQFAFKKNCLTVNCAAADFQWHNQTVAWLLDSIHITYVVFVSYLWRILGKNSHMFFSVIIFTRCQHTFSRAKHNYKLYLCVYLNWNINYVQPQLTLSSANTYKTNLTESRLQIGDWEAVTTNCKNLNFHGRILHFYYGVSRLLNLFSDDKLNIICSTFDLLLSKINKES